MRTTVILTVALLLVPLAHAQDSYIGCDANPCTETKYGLGSAGSEPPFAPGAFEPTFVGPGDGSCGLPVRLPIHGKMRLRELDNCDVSASNRCMIEIVQQTEDSGFWVRIAGLFDLGPLGLLAVSANTLEDAGRAGNIGHRQLHGSCTADGGEECALDSDCPSGTSCLSACFSDPATSCASQADCPNADCVTEIEWDGIGTCTDDATFCTSDADCPAGTLCEGGFDWERSEFSCACCQSVTGVLCPEFNQVEYPAVSCPELADPEFASLMSPDWLFEGGAGTPFGMEDTIIPGQQEGKCAANEARPCGFRGDFWAGGANGKCTGAPPCGADPFDPANPALASTCDEVDFGGIAGDFCNLVETGIREDRGKNPDGTPDVTQCSVAAFHVVGFPNTMCAISDPLPEGDPQAGCLLANLGVATRPDLDCNGIDDSIEGRCMPVGGANCSEPDLCPPCADDGDCASGNCVNNGDLCPFLGEANWFLDSNNDDVGDECQCGDGNGDGVINALDIGVTAQCANGVILCDSTQVDTDANNATNAIDIGGVAQAANGVVATTDLRCPRNIDTSAGGG